MGVSASSMTNMGNPTVRANPDFNADQAAQDVKSAIEGWGTDEKALIQVFTRVANWQRQEIASAYKQSYGKDLMEELKDECGGNFERVLVALLTPPILYDARLLREAMAGAGTDEEVLIEVIGTKSNEHLAELKAVYNKEFDRDLVEDVESETSGDFKRLLISLLNAGRQEGVIDPDLAAQDAEKLFQAGEAKFGTDESEFNRIFCLRDARHLQIVMAIYEQNYENTLESVVESEISGSACDGYLAILKYVRDSNAYYAELLQKSMKGLGTNDQQLVRTIVTRSEIDLHDIRTAFQTKYGKSLEEWVRDDLGGDYEKIILAILNPRD